jgi:hypothetical protein
MTTSEGAPRAAAPPGEEDAGGEEALWAAAQADDRQAFTELYHRHADAVWRHAHRLTSSPTAAEDVLAATFLTTWRRRGEADPVRGSGAAGRAVGLSASGCPRVGSATPC